MTHERYPPPAAPAAGFERFGRRSWREVLGLFLHTFAETLDIGLLVAGTGLLGLSITVVLDGFGVVDLGLTDSAGAMLGSGLVIAVVGGFALGVAAEGPIAYAHRRGTYSELELAGQRAIALVAVGALFAWLAAIARGRIAELPYPFVPAVEFLAAVGVAGTTVAVALGVPLLWGIRRSTSAGWWVEELEAPLLYIVWAIAAAVLFAVRT